MIDLDADTQSFYNDFFKSPEPDVLLFGLTTAKMGSSGEWEMAKRRAATAEQIEDWLGAGIRNKFECHLALGYIPAPIVDLETPGSESYGTYDHKELRRSISRIFVLDLDVHHNKAKKRKDTDYRDGNQVTEAIQTALDSGMPEPNYIVRTGSGGAHLWYFISNAVSQQSHIAVLKEISEKAATYGIMSDPQAGYPKKNIRAPGSWNMKPHIKACARTSKIRSDIYANRTFKKAWGLQTKLEIGQAAEVLEFLREESNLQDYETYKSADVKESCRYMLEQLRTGSKDLYREQWLGVATVVRHLEGWPEAWGKACMDHYGDVTQAQIDSALDENSGLKGPITCEAMGGGIDEHPACSGCQHRTMTRGAGYPINWIQHVAGLRAAELPVPQRYKKPNDGLSETAEPEKFQSMHMESVADVDRVQGYGAFESAHQVYQLSRMELKRGKKVYDDPICDTAFYIEEVITRSSGAVAKIQTHNMEYEIPNDMLQNDKSLAKALGALGFQVYHTKHTQWYMQAQIRTFPPIRTFEAKSVGWNDSRSVFTTVMEKITASNINGDRVLSRMEYPPLNGATVGEKGTVQGWRDAMKPALEHEAYVLIMFMTMGFAAPLACLRSEKAQPAAMLSAYHPDTGKGKSTGLRMMNSVFMKPLETNIGFNDTDASIYQDIGSLRHLGVAIDEITSKINSLDWDLTGFVNQLLQGQERGRLTSNAKRAERQSWDTVISLSTNASIVDRLRESKSTAAMARVHEFFFDSLPMPKYAADDMIVQLGKHHGVAGPYFIRKLMATQEYRTVIRQQIDRKMEYLESRVGYNNAYRFVMTTFALSLVVRDLLEKFEILTIPKAEYTDFIVEELQKRAQVDRQQSRRAEVSVSDFYNAKYLDVYDERGHTLNPDTVGLTRTPEYPIFYQSGYLFVDDRAFGDWCRKHRVPQSVKQIWLARGYHDGEVTKRTFKVGENVTAPTDYFKIDVSASMGAHMRIELDRKCEEVAGG